jgi:voltage-gated potassium channel Kch
VPAADTIRGVSAESWLSRRLRPDNHLVVCGDDPLAHRLVDELVTRYHANVTVILRDKRRNHGPEIARLRVPLVESERLDADAFRRARLGAASALALVQQDDVGNIHAALQAQELNPDLRLVIRMFNTSLGHGVERLFADCSVLSDASMATPAFVAAALGEVAPMTVRLPGRTLYVARRTEVRPSDVVCGLAAMVPGGHADLLPADQDRADLVLAAADGRSALSGVREPGPPADGLSRQTRFRLWLRRRRRYPLGSLTALISRKLRITALVLVALLVVATVVMAWVLHTGLSNAAYITLLDTLGGANADPNAGAVQKVTESVLTLVSIALIPLITAAVVEAVVNARLALALGRLKEPIHDHVIVAGLGNVGTRVIRHLHDLGIPVVAIDKNENARGIPVARRLDIPYIVGDVSREETLRSASVQTCRALLVVSTDDMTNLEAALQGRNLKEDLRVVLRLFDGDFADRVQRVFGIPASRSVSYLAAPAFALAMLEREVKGTIPVGRRVLLIAEVPVCAGSVLHGQPLSAANETRESRVIALMEGQGRSTVWSPPERALSPDDRLLVVATRAGLSGLLARTAPPGRRPGDVVAS